MYIGIAGNIGVGKTTLAKIISKELDFTLVEESVDNNPFLEDFYSNTPRWAFPTQMYFVVNRLKNLISQKGNIVTDRTLIEDFKIFAEKMRIDGLISKREFDVYVDFYNLLKPLMPEPDLLVYAKASVPKLKSNILKRGRKMEFDLVSSKNTYIFDLNILYTNLMSSYDSKKLLTLDFDTLDVVKNKQDVHYILGEICSKLYL